MNEVTPDLIAQIATRLYNEIPGVNHVWTTNSEASDDMPDVSGIPEIPAGLPSLPGVQAVSPETSVAPSVPQIAPTACGRSSNEFDRRRSAPAPASVARCKTRTQFTGCSRVSPCRPKARAHGRAGHSQKSFPPQTSRFMESRWHGSTMRRRHRSRRA